MNIGLPCLILWFVLDGPDMVLWGMSWVFTQDIVPLLQDVGTCDVEQWVIKWLTIFWHELSHPWNLRRWIDGLGLSRFGHDGTQMGWKPTCWQLYPRDYYSSDEGCCTSGHLDALQRWDTLLSTLVTMPYTLDIGLPLMMMSHFRVWQWWGLMTTWDTTNDVT